MQIKSNVIEENKLPSGTVEFACSDLHYNALIMEKDLRMLMKQCM
jgi:hypothetical protein